MLKLYIYIYIYLYIYISEVIQNMKHRIGFRNIEYEYHYNDLVVKLYVCIIRIDYHGIRRLNRC